MNVLLVEDDRWLAESFTRSLTSAGYQVQVAENTLDAIEQIDTAPPNVIVLDLFLPGPNGIVLLHELQSHSDLADIPVVLCTNTAAELPKESLAPYGVRRVLDKTTMHPSDLVAAVRGLL